MFKRGNYSTRASSTFEIIASFIVDLYYNHFYQEAKRIRIEGRVESITDGYKHAIKAYLNSFEDPVSYRKTIVGIHRYYYTTTKFSTISFAECVNEIVKHFLPDEFFESTTNQQRDGILRRVLLNSVKQFSSDVLCSNLLDTLIDNHTDPGMVRRMQDKMVQALMFEREKMFQEMFNVSNKPAGNGDFTLVMKMKNEMVKLVKDNHGLTCKYNKLKDKALELLDIVKVQKEKINTLTEQSNIHSEQHGYRSDKYHNEHNTEDTSNVSQSHNFDKYQPGRKYENTGGEDPRTLHIPDENKQTQYPFMRVPRTDLSYQHKYPKNNIPSYTQDALNTSYDELPPQETSDNLIISEIYDDKTAEHNDTVVKPDIPNNIDDTNGPVSYIRPSNTEFFMDNMMDIN